MKKALRFVVILVVILIGIIYYFNLKNQTLPIISPADVNPELVDPSIKKGEAHFISDFKLTDQKGEVVTQDVVEGKIYVADFFFTTCTSICPVMTGQMNRVAEVFKDNDRVKFMSFSVTPDTDTPEVLATYASDHDIDYHQWKLMTGDKADIYSLARKSYFTLKEAEVGEGDGGESDFIHTNNFVLVDSKNRIRGYFDGTSLRDIDRLIDAINILLRKDD